MKLHKIVALGFGALLLSSAAVPALASENAPASSASVHSERFRDEASRLFGINHGGAIALNVFPASERSAAAALDTNRNGYLDQQEFDQHEYANN